MLELCRQADKLFPEGIDILVNNAGKPFEFPEGYIDGKFENNMYTLWKCWTLKKDECALQFNLISASLIYNSNGYSWFDINDIDVF